MGNNQIDVVLGGLFTVSAATTLGIADVTLFDQSLSEVLATIGGFDITYAVMVSLLVLAGAWLVNKPRLDMLSQEQKLLVGGTVAVVGASVVAPSLLDPVTSSVALALVALGIEAGGFWAIAQEG